MYQISTFSYDSFARNGRLIFFFRSLARDRIHPLVSLSVEGVPQSGLG